GCAACVARPAAGSVKCPSGLPKFGIPDAAEPPPCGTASAPTVPARPASSSLPTPANCSTASMLVRVPEVRTSRPTRRGGGCGSPPHEQRPEVSDWDRWVRPRARLAPRPERTADMKVLVIGASGAIGRRLVPQLLDLGHEVFGTCHAPENTEKLRSLGAAPTVLDVLDPGAVREVVAETEPDAIIHEATSLADASFGRNFDRIFAQTSRLRTEGTDNLLAAARETEVSKFVAQSFASMRSAREGDMVKSEDDPLDPEPPAQMREGFDA